MHIFKQKFISITLALSQKYELEKWPLRNSFECMMIYRKRLVSVRSKENLKLSYGGPGQREALDTNQRIKALRQGCN